MTKEKAKARVPGLTGSPELILIFFINQNDVVFVKRNQRITTWFLIGSLGQPVWSTGLIGF
jgi:lipid-A-disaccharide synthase-like uncharacterized protein